MINIWQKQRNQETPTFRLAFQGNQQNRMEKKPIHQVGKKDDKLLFLYKYWSEWTGTSGIYLLGGVAITKVRTIR
tara:strand:- start:544 stop:768 length:225 start_codon:yes stop_codon:yes gene_type:complete